jgi:hypothetical protein
MAYDIAKKKKTGKNFARSSLTPLEQAQDVELMVAVRKEESASHRGLLKSGLIILGGFVGWIVLKKRRE